MMQAIDRMSAGLTWKWLLFPLGVLTVASIAGSTSAWVSGSAPILFVSGLDRYLPASFGQIHSRYGSPYVALCVFGALASAIIMMSFIGVSIKEAYVTLLDLSVALQMISYLYVFAALFPHAFSTAPISGYFPRGILRLPSVVGTAMTVVALVMVFVPSGQISSIWAFELKMVITLGVLLAAARALYLYYSQRTVYAEVDS